MLTKQQNKSLARSLKAISHPLRLQILQLLAEQELSVGQVHKALKTNLSQPAISQHLRYLLWQDFLLFNKVGRQIFFRVNKHSVGWKIVETVLKEQTA